MITWVQVASSMIPKPAWHLSSRLLAALQKCAGDSDPTQPVMRQSRTTPQRKTVRTFENMEAPSNRLVHGVPKRRTAPGKTGGDPSTTCF